MDRYLLVLIVVVIFTGCSAPYLKSSDSFEKRLLWHSVQDKPDLVAVDGTVAYRAEQRLGLKELVVKGGKVVAKGDSIKSLTWINDRLAYLVERNGEKMIVHAGKRYGEQYRGLGPPRDIGGQVGFQAWDGETEFLVYNGTEIGREYQHIDDIGTVNGRLTFTAGYEDRNEFIVYGGEKRGEVYDSVRSPTSINGKLAFIGRTENRSVIVIGGAEKQPEYTIGSAMQGNSLVGVNGDAVYVGVEYAGPFSETEKTFVVRAGKKISKNYDTIDMLDTYRENVVYRGITSGGPARYSWLGYRNETFGRFVHDFAFVNGSVAYVGVTGLPKDTLSPNDQPAERPANIYLDGRKISNDYEEIEALGTVDGRLVFLARDSSVLGRQSYLVRQTEPR